jgi:ribosomal protein S8
MTINVNFSYMIASLKGASKQHKSNVRVPKTKFNKKILLAMYNKGYVSDFFVDSKTGNNFVVEFSFVGTASDLSNLKIYSKSSQRKYLTFKQMSRKFNVSDFFILSTSKGILLGHEAFFYGLGGELLAVLE